MYQRDRSHQKVSAIAALCVPPKGNRVQQDGRWQYHQHEPLGIVYYGDRLYLSMGGARMAIVSREFLLAFWKVHILHHAAEGPVYGHWIAEELRAHGYAISPGTLYPLLARMERNGWLASRATGPGLKARKNYTLTLDGKELLRLLQGQVEELFEEVCVKGFDFPRRPGPKAVTTTKKSRGPATPARRATVDGRGERPKTARMERAR